jgi:hypothetical protein
VVLERIYLMAHPEQDRNFIMETEEIDIQNEIAKIYNSKVKIIDEQLLKAGQVQKDLSNIADEIRQGNVSKEDMPGLQKKFWEKHRQFYYHLQIIKNTYPKNEDFLKLAKQVNK